MNAQTPWPADAVERRPIGTLAGYAKNARTHSDEQVDQIAASMREWGFTIPLLVDEASVVIAGHGRFEAAKRLGYETVPVMVARGWSDRQIRAYRIADNQLALNAAWDVKRLADELGELVGLESLMGFAKGELPVTKGLTDPDEAPPLPAQPASVAGDLWICGSHRLLCGDATDAASVARLLGDAKPSLMATDPPYGVNYDPEWRDGADLGVGQRSTGKVPNDDRADWYEAWVLFAGSVAYVWHGGLHAGEVQASLERAGFSMRAQIVWAKQHFVMSRGDYHWKHEPCWYAVRKGRRPKWQGDAGQSTLWSIQNNNAFGGQHEEKFGHGTQKPVECMRRPIINNSSPGQGVYDPFVGSGTTIIAAEMEGRRAFCIDVAPGYIDVAVQRWQAFTGKPATLDGDERAFDVIAAERLGAAA